MSSADIERLGGGVVKRKTKRKLGLFIDGTGLDRATRRLERKVDLSRLVAGITEGLTPEVARYYTLVPYEDDARQFSFLDAVERAGLEVIVKRLPPKGVKRQVSMDVHMASDMMLFANAYFAQKKKEANGSSKAEEGEDKKIVIPPKKVEKVRRQAVVVCPTRELTYCLYMLHTIGIETHLADFGLYGSSDGWQGIDRWIDLSTSETIWR